MRLLILGGTEFVGRATAEEALRRDWHVTVFHRGRSAPPDGTTALNGDRTASGGLTALAHGTWDIVVDTWSGAPDAVRESARLLAGRVGQYAYISTRSVYTHPLPPGADEQAPVVPASPGAGPAETGDTGDTGDTAENYARVKRGAELAALESFADRALLARPGLILGPHENVGRLPWWLLRIARGGTVLAPGPPELPVQYIDVRDLANWTLDSAARGLGGPFNLTTPRGQHTMGELLETCARVTASDAELRWTEPERIAAADIAPWTELPVWLPPGELHDTLHDADIGKALSAGLRYRPLKETVADTWQWLSSLDSPPHHPTVGLPTEKETRALRTER